MKNQRPQREEYADYYNHVIDLAEGKNIIQVLKTTHIETLDLLNQIDEKAWEYRYAPDKWSVGEVLQHNVDCERVFAYRALSISKGDPSPLPGFDQDLWVKATTMTGKQNDFLEDLIAVRQSTISLFQSFNDEQLLQKGMASNNPVSVRSIGFIIAGHERHHIQVIKERYL